MGKITCRCGHLISTNHDSLESYRGDLLPEVHGDKWAEAELKQLKALVTAIESGQSLADFTAPGSSELVIDALLPWKISGDSFTNFSRSVYQCNVCGRLLVETNRSNEFRTFLPESDDSHHILDA
jgi:hypothetical protein